MNLKHKKALTTPYRIWMLNEGNETKDHFK